MDSADQLARLVTKQSMDDIRCLEIAYQRTLGRMPSEQELRRDMNFLADVRSQGSHPAMNRQSAWSLLCQGLMICNEFVYLR